MWEPRDRDPPPGSRFAATICGARLEKSNEFVARARVRVVFPGRSVAGGAPARYAAEPHASDSATRRCARGRWAVMPAHRGSNTTFTLLHELVDVPVFLPDE